jgi:hypothetical protein
MKTFIHIIIANRIILIKIQFIILFEFVYLKKFSDLSCLQGRKPRYHYCDRRQRQKCFDQNIQNLLQIKLLRQQSEDLKKNKNHMCNSKFVQGSM